MPSVSPTHTLRSRWTLWPALAIAAAAIACSSDRPEAAAAKADPAPAAAPDQPASAGTSGAIGKARTDTRARQTTGWRYTLTLRTTSQSGEALQYPSALSGLVCQRSTVNLVSWTGPGAQAARMSSSLEGDVLTVTWALQGPDDVCVPEGADRTCLVDVSVNSSGGSVSLTPADRCHVAWRPTLNRGALNDSHSRARTLKDLRDLISSMCAPSPSDDWRRLPVPVVSERWSCAGEEEGTPSATLELWTDPGSGDPEATRWAELTLGGEGPPPKEETLMGWYMTWLALIHPDGTSPQRAMFSTLRTAE